MKNSFLRVISLILITAVLVCCAACSGKGNNPTPNTTENSKKTSSTAPIPKGQTSRYSFVSATLDGKNLTVRVDSKSGVTEDQCPLDENIPVEGLTGEYDRVFVGPHKLDWWPIVYLLCKDGTVEYIDVLDCMMEDDKKLVNGGKINMPAKITDFTFHDVPDEMHGSYRTSFAVDEHGNERRLDWAIFFTQKPQFAPPTAEEAINTIFETDHGMSMVSSIEAPDVSVQSADMWEEINYEGETYYCTLAQIYTDQGDHMETHEHLAVGRDDTIFRLDVATDKWNYVSKIMG